MDKKEELTFEQAMEKLERIVESLEEGDVPLEEAIAKYKEGMDLAKICHQKLKNAEEQLTQILKDNGEVDNFVIEEE
ncbi:MAG: exodeoxyribonuclease VII small subunit [Caldibacillus debilis]|uniref:Exodeoxyribonuclease 7 small subunit n=2 Tax=Caldibacillus debilis TaxID=301148 RepID=A0A420VET0_9BACI|nr:exodeoxyribonuclease VII small subunit [Caldibacillus debilis]MBO2481579.1 exodeoxyribonuclease VII small subunit [Bacillaceae bacterium]KYD20485.1 Exodeoxyribonuclease VII small subunit [Caldibacillus debilis]MBY6271695.1 exodeoxyribonuclease VII small subunit [Bacillaceae bacterium]REJ14351.1 MAG: exodeoxyribonuclease VII small subunit [Caldibacillus debilis]REJ27205.1 MAG: exodeoxyribonuclease VII small subunit [Caldibacillus debilis]